MKTILIIGLGRFGHHLCMNLIKRGNEVMVVDEKEEYIEDLVPYVTNARIGDCTNPEVLKSLGVGNFDLCFVCIGTNFQSSLEITCMVKEMGAKYVISKANRDIHAKFLLKNGADEVIYPDRDIAEKLAVKWSANHVFDYIELSEEYSIYEIPPCKKWVGRSIKEVDARAKYHVNILGVRGAGRMSMMPGADYVFAEQEHLMVMGKNEDVERILKHISD